MTPARASGASGDWAASRQTLRGAAGRREVRESTRYTPQTKIRKPSRAELRPRRAHAASIGSGPRTGFRLGFRRRKIAAKAAIAVARTTPSTRAARARRAIDAEGDADGGANGAAKGKSACLSAPLAGRVRSAFHPMREAAGESPGLRRCADDHDQRRDRPGRSGERPELRRNVGTR